MNRTFAPIWIAVLLAAGLSGPVSGQETYVATLTGPRAGSTSPATGTATLVLDAAATRIDFTISHDGLSSREVASHIHYIQGGIAFTLPKGNPKVGTWTSPTALDIMRLRAGDLYVNIHSDDHPTGEIAGDIVTAPTPVDAATWGVSRRFSDPDNCLPPDALATATSTYAFVYTGKLNFFHPRRIFSITFRTIVASYCI